MRRYLVTDWEEIFVFGLTDRSTKTESVSVGVGDGELAEAPSLIDGSGMDGRFWTAGCVETAVAKRAVTLVDVSNEDAVDRSEDTVSGMTRQLKLGSVANEVDDSIREFAIQVAGPLMFEVEDGGIEVERRFEVADLDDGNDSHDELLYF
jgi:hypothetical protein